MIEAFQISRKKVAQMSRQTGVKNKILDPVFHEGS